MNRIVIDSINRAGKALSGRDPCAAHALLIDAICCCHGKDGLMVRRHAAHALSSCARAIAFETAHGKHCESARHHMACAQHSVNCAGFQWEQESIRHKSSASAANCNA